MTTVGFVRVLLFGTDLGEAIAIAVSLYVVVITSIIVGAALPLLLNAASIDPAHASTTIQVIMDVSVRKHRRLVATFPLTLTS